MIYRKLPYFAFGSNLNLSQMQLRCKFANNMGSATLPDYALTFRGVADIEPAAGRKVYGGLFRITERCLAALDRYEGFPHLYTREAVTVIDEDGDYVPAFAYIMNPGAGRGVSMPGRWYFETIRTGFRDFSLPERALFEALDSAADAVWSAESYEPEFAF